ncbi:MAG: hypothetical protein AB9869_32795 [Verrucomicrobiia bacterium]
MKTNKEQKAAKTANRSSAAQPAPKQPKTEPAPERPSKGKFGSLLGYSVVSVIRAMGKAGWDFAQAKAALDKAAIPAATHTIKIALRRGRNGEKRIAPLSPAELAPLLPEEPKSKKQQPKQPKTQQPVTAA